MATDIVDWFQIKITFKIKCYKCGKEILPGKAFWSESAKTAKHLACNKEKVIDKLATTVSSPPPPSLPHLARNISTESSKPITRATTTTTISTTSKSILTVELNCFICGNKAGCGTCIFAKRCDRTLVSQSCICEQCMNQYGGESFFDTNQQSFIHKLNYVKKSRTVRTL